MKRFAVSAILVSILAIVLASCASSRQYGCPNNTQNNYRYRG